MLFYFREFQGHFQGSYAFQGYFRGFQGFQGSVATMLEDDVNITSVSLIEEATVEMVDIYLILGSFTSFSMISFPCFWWK